MSNASNEQTHRRRLDQVLEPSFSEPLDQLEIEELSARRLMAHEVENELSYYRRLLHGRLDLLKFELRRRRGEESMSLLEALPQILSDREIESEPRARHIMTDLPPLPDVGRREVDHVLGDGVLTRLDEIDDDGIESAIQTISDLETQISDQRRRVQEVVDTLASEISSRYRDQQNVGS